MRSNNQENFVNNPVDRITYTTSEVADRLKMSERSVFNQRASGLLPFNQTGKKGRVFFYEEDLQEYYRRIKRN